MYVQDASCALLSINPPLRLLEGGHDVMALGLLESEQIFWRIRVGRLCCDGDGDVGKRRWERLTPKYEVWPSGKNHCALDHILKFSDVARPRISDEALHHVTWHVRDLPTDFDRVAFDKIVRQERNILWAFT